MSARRRKFAQTRYFPAQRNGPYIRLFCKLQPTWKPYVWVAADRAGGASVLPMRSNEGGGGTDSGHGWATDNSFAWVPGIFAVASYAQLTRLGSFSLFRRPGPNPTTR
jgi:hypothetical protein